MNVTNMSLFQNSNVANVYRNKLTNLSKVVICQIFVKYKSCQNINYKIVVKY